MSDFDDDDDRMDEAGAIGGPSDEDFMEFLNQFLEQNPDLVDEFNEEEKSVATVIAESPYSVIGGAPIHPENIPPQHDYVVTLKFSTRDDKATVDKFFEELLTVLPNGTHTNITTTGEVINVEDLTWGNVGSTIRVFVEGRTVEGKLDAIYTTGLGSGVSQTLIIDGKAWSLSFGVAEINV